MMKRRSKTLAALFLTGAMVLGMGTSAFAVDPTPTTDPESGKNGVPDITSGIETLKKSYLLKNFVMDQNVTCPAADFTFTFTPKGVNEDEYTDPQTKNTDMPTTLGNGNTSGEFKVSYAAADTAVVNGTNGTNQTTADDVDELFKDDLADDNRTKGISIAYILGMTKLDGTAYDGTDIGRNAEGVFTHAGEYVYEVNESATAYTPGADEIIMSSGANYRFRVFVENVTVDANHPHGVAIKGVTVTRIMNQDGTTATNPTVKVDPDPAGTTHPADGQQKFDTDTSFAFENTFIKKSSLNIKKLVDNTYGDKDKAFPFKLTMTLPASTPATILTNLGFGGGAGKVTAEIWSGAGTSAAKVAGSTDVEFTFASSGTPATLNSTNTFLLKDGEYLHFNTSLPVGTTYKVEELLATPGSVTGAAVADQYANYTPSYKVDSASATGAKTQVKKDGTDDDKGKDYTVGVTATDANAGTIVGEFNTLNAGVGGNTANINANLTEITNKYQDVTITGILMNNLPFILIIVAALVGIVGYVALKRRFAR